MTESFFNSCGVRRGIVSHHRIALEKPGFIDNAMCKVLPGSKTAVRDRSLESYKVMVKGRICYRAFVSALSSFPRLGHHALTG